MKKKVFAGISLLILLLSTLFVFAACGPNVTEISIDRNNMPQTVFVLGNDLDLSKGKLKVNGSSSISMNSPEVTVSGYDKNQEGTQTLTISYGGKTTELTITVVPRFRPAENYIYFIGEEYADAQPRLNITRDDGTQITVNADDPALTVSNFDTSEATDKLTLDLVYDKDNDHFEGSFDIAVYEPTVTFRVPRKLEYGNHETEIDLTGASVTLKSTDGSATRNVALTSLVASGYDPTAITADNKEATQKITVTYRGREVGNFNIQVSYSSVSEFKDAAAKLSTLDWDCYRPATASDPGMKVPAAATEDMMKNAVEMLTLYLGLSKTETAYISQNELDSVARLAVVYGYNTWMQTVENTYSEAFLISEVGDISYTCDTIEKAQAASAKLTAASDENTKLIFSLGDLLNNTTLQDKCANSNIYTTVIDGEAVTLKISDLASLVKNSSFMKDIIEVLNWSVNAFDLLKEIPSPQNFADWNDLDLSNYKDKFEEAYTTLTEILESDATNRSIYLMLNGWREKDDYFDFLYHYYVLDADNSSSETAQSSILKISNLSTMMLPVPLENLRNLYLNAAVDQMLLQSYADNYASTQQVPLLTESTLFIYDFIQARNATNAFFDDENYSSNQTYTFLYISFLQETFDSLYSGSYGYSSLLGDASYDKEVEDLWKVYIELWTQYQTKEDDFTEEEQAAFDAKVGAMFNDFASLMPNQQYYFLSSLNYLYTEKFPVSALYPSDGSLYSDFAIFIYSYYSEQLGIDLSSEEEDIAYKIFTDLLCAIEFYSCNDIDSFCIIMQSAQESYNDWLDPDRKSKFDSCLKLIFDQYIEYFNLYTEEDSKWVYDSSSLGEDLGGFKDTFDNLLNATGNASLASSLIDLQSNSIQLYLPFLASYQQICTLEAKILASGNQDIINAYYHMAYGESYYAEPLYCGVYKAKAAFERYKATFLLTWASSFSDPAEATDFESATGLFKFLETYGNYFWTAAQMQAASIKFAGEKFEFTAENVSALTKAFLELSAPERYFLISLDASLNLYHGGLELGLAEIFENSTAQPLISQLLTLEITYIAYEKDPDGTITDKDPDSNEDVTIALKDYVLQLWTELSQAYSELQIPEDIDQFNAFFGDMYNFFKTACEALKAA